MLLPPRRERESIPQSLHCRIHGGTVLCVAEIGMYRCRESDHISRMNKAEKELEQTANGCEDIAKGLLQHFADTTWTPWQYNQDVGWLRIYAYPRTTTYGTPIVSGEYFAIDARRFSKDLKRRRFLWAGEAFGVVFEEPIDSPDVFDRVSCAIEEWSQSDKIRSLTLDLAVWQNIGPHVNWSAILFPELKNKPD